MIGVVVKRASVKNRKKGGAAEQLAEKLTVCITVDSLNNWRKKWKDSIKRVT